MTDTAKPNSAKGRESFDITVGDQLVHFFNRNSTPYPTEVSAPDFSPVPVQQHKDVMINVARLHAEQEYNRIMQLVAVLQQQAQDIQRRMHITDMVHAAKYNFKLAHGGIYWLAEDQQKNQIILCSQGPEGWSSGAPDHYRYIMRVQWLGDFSWREILD